MGYWIVLRNIGSLEFEKLFKDKSKAETYAAPNGFCVQYHSVQGHYEHPNKLFVASTHNRYDSMEFVGLFATWENANASLKSKYGTAKSEIMGIMPLDKND